MSYQPTTPPPSREQVPSRQEVDDALLHLRRNANHSVPSEVDVLIVAHEIARLRVQSAAFARLVRDLSGDLQLIPAAAADAETATVLEVLVQRLLASPEELDRIAEAILAAPGGTVES